MTQKTQHILFLCTANAIRSQMAEGYARKVLPKNVSVYSAGTMPGGVHPMSIEAMKEIGIDISHHRSKSIADIPADKIDLVITLCGNADQVCPEFPKKTQRLHWPIPDPYQMAKPGEDIFDAFRAARDDIIARVQDWAKSANLLDIS